MPARQDITSDKCCYTAYVFIAVSAQYHATPPGHRNAIADYELLPAADVNATMMS